MVPSSGRRQQVPAGADFTGTGGKSTSRRAENARRQPIDQAVWKKMEPNIFYVAGGYDSSDDHARLSATIPYEILCAVRVG